MESDVLSQFSSSGSGDGEGVAECLEVHCLEHALTVQLSKPAQLIFIVSILQIGKLRLKQAYSASK